jgi:hypothetical protein
LVEVGNAPVGTREWHRRLRRNGAAAPGTCASSLCGDLALGRIGAGLGGGGKCRDLARVDLALNIPDQRRDLAARRCICPSASPMT